MDLLSGLFFAVVFIVALVWHIHSTPENDDQERSKRWP
jgi:hypothetical protein